ncbi:restriction endonuclease subunit S [Pelistega suis]|uniref:Restriction endonuclease subunit S n=1 Tax=Pelistega suis TaxID=1631957 RepID=A0A849P4J9_9BURK|nr:restriction endonuclease subunit S [Pelistega suis]NOL52500.1 restriction endonuclease subunit S [Pelistega suis]
MNEKKMLVPKLRFPEFTDAWEQRKLGEVFKYEQPTKYIVKSTDYDNNYKTPVLTAGQSFILGYTNETEGIKDATAKHPVVIFDDFTTSSHYVDFSFKIKSSAMKLLSVINENFNTIYAFYLLKNIAYVPSNHERHWISIFSNFDVKIASLQEQQKIGSFFALFERYITIHQRKLENLKKLKTGLLQKMFSKNNQQFPDLRFPEFTDAWEQRKLGEVGDFSAGGDVDKEKLTPLGKYPVIANALTNDGIIGYYDYFKFTAPAVTITGRGEVGIAKARYTNFTAVVRLLVLQPKSKYDIKFLEEAINLKNIYVESTGVPQLTVPQIRIYEITIPVLKEQQKIGDFFAQLDRYITIHQRKLENLKTLKKSLLQQMFV